MIFSDDLVVIFNQNTKSKTDVDYGVPQAPLLTYVLGAWFKGKNITENIFSDKYEALFGLKISRANDFYGPFNSQEELQKFTYLLAEEIKAKEVNLLPLDVFSRVVLESTSLEELKNSIKDSSDIIENIEMESAPSSLLDKLLSKNR